MRRRRNPTDHEYLYHATFLKNLEGIIDHGILPGGASQYGGGYTAHSQGRVFFTEFGGLHFWMSRLENIAHAESDFRGGDDDTEKETFGWTPVGLRVADDLFNEEPQIDRLGSIDSGYEAFFVTGVIDPDSIEVWDGEGWVELADVDTSRMLRKVEKAAVFERDDAEEDEDEDDRGWIELDFDLLVPRKP